jgi:hypothetical protein
MMVPVVATLAEHATAIRALRSRIVEDVAEIGRRLIEVKDIVGHGNWLPWLDREFGWTEQTALNFIHVHNFVEGLSNSKTIRNLVLTLPVSSVYLLAAPSTPSEARDEIIERAQAGEVPISEAKRIIKDIKGRTAKKAAEKTSAKSEPVEPVTETKTAHEPKPAPDGETTLYCSFCARSEHDVATLVVGPCIRKKPVCICNECVDVCVSAIAEQLQAKATPPTTTTSASQKAYCATNPGEMTP